MSEYDEEDLDHIKSQAVKSATEIINGISSRLYLRDLDLILINYLMLPKSLDIYNVTEDWRSLDYRKSGLFYGSLLGILVAIVAATGSLPYLPIIIAGIFGGRYYHLSRQLQELASRKSSQTHITHIAKYLLISKKRKSKAVFFKDVNSKYLILKYIKNRRSISGKQFIRLFVAADKDIGFNKIVNDVIDEVLIYALTHDDADLSARVSEQPSLPAPVHVSHPEKLLEEPPKTSERNNATLAAASFATAMSGAAAHTVVSEDHDSVDQSDSVETPSTSRSESEEFLEDQESSQDSTSEGESEEEISLLSDNEDEGIDLDDLEGDEEVYRESISDDPFGRSSSDDADEEENDGGGNNEDDEDDVLAKLGLTDEDLS